MRKGRSRFYHCLISGLQFHSEKDIYFLTLTSARNGLRIEDSFNQLRVELRRLGQFEYAMVKTSEGNGVLHILFFGDRLDVDVVREKWDRIHGKGVNCHIQFDLRYVTDNARIAGYLLAQYVAGQDKFIRYSCSRRWLWKGYRRDWMNLVKKEGFEEALKRWTLAMNTKRKVNKQSDLNGEIVKGVCGKF